MNDAQIRKNFHLKKLHKQHANPDTLVINELGLKHGKCRADIAVINGHLIGYEIKSDSDSLRRLEEQVQIYSTIFDSVALILSESHLIEAKKIIPRWWGIILAKEGRRGGVNFKVVREKKFNPFVDDFSVAQLLWHEEAQAILLNLGLIKASQKYTRALLYEKLVDSIESGKLRKIVRECLRNRKTWRYPVLPSLSGGLSLPSAK